MASVTHEPKPPKRQLKHVVLRDVLSHTVTGFTVVLADRSKNEPLHHSWLRVRSMADFTGGVHTLKIAVEHPNVTRIRFSHRCRNIRDTFLAATQSDSRATQPTSARKTATDVFDTPERHTYRPAYEMSSCDQHAVPDASGLCQVPYSE